MNTPVVAPTSTAHGGLQAAIVAVPQSANGALFLGTKEVCTVFRFSRSTLYRLIDAGEFPHPIKIGLGKNGWLRSDIDAYLNERIAARGVAQ